MAAITKRSTTDGVRYDVRWRLADGTQRKRTFKRRANADNYRRYIATVRAHPHRRGR